MQQIMSKEKLYLKRTEVKELNVPNWPELGVSRMWAQAMKQPLFNRYIPDCWGPEKKTERTFFWAIFVTLQPEYVEILVDDCRRQRDALRIGPRPPVVREIFIHPDFVQALQRAPQRSSKYQLQS